MINQYYSNLDKNLIIFGMGCFWGVEKLFWGIDGVKMTAVGYSGGNTDLPDYQKVCTGLTGSQRSCFNKL